MAELSPMMRQYMETKEAYRDCILFYRLGDFYEMFYEDALVASKELEITLTGKQCGQQERAPMCGVPYHSVDSYLNKMVQKGYKVAICEQIENPSTSRGIVRREVVRVVTPGTNLDTQALDEQKNNYIMCAFYTGGRFGIALADVTTGDYYVTETDSGKKFVDEIQKFSPSELICNEELHKSGIALEPLKDKLHMAIYPLEAWYFDTERCTRLLKDHFKANSLEGLGVGEYPCGAMGAGALLQYLYETQKNSLPHIIAIKPYSSEDFMLVDGATRRNLELVETMREKQKKGSLLWVLDRTKTAMGARLLRSLLEQPLIEVAAIQKRQEAVAAFNRSVMARDGLREFFGKIYDLERIVGKICYKSANPRDLVAFQQSISLLPQIKALLSEVEAVALMGEIDGQLDELQDLSELLADSLQEDPPISLKEGGFVKSGFHQEIDHLRQARTEGKTWLAQLEAEERERTGIKNLRIKYNKIFGYYLEVTNSNKDMVPEDYIRKQTLANCERFITPKLKELEDVILGAEEKLTALEYEVFCNIRDAIAKEITRIQGTAKSIAWLDVLAALSFVAVEQRYCMPEISTGGEIDIRGGRHPVVEKMMSNDLFIANDVYLDQGDNRISIITGPNMAGKSTYMRQAALIVLMAQIGSFVPADSARIGIVDRIFTRVGASDDLASGQSTFMVEMTEMANILRNATRNSLLVLDEIGRGTSTFDGLSIARAAVEYISNMEIIGAKTLFATHYHELTELEGRIPGVHNYCIAVKENGDDIVFLRKIIRGGADKSYGIQVAKIAGVPEAVIARAKVILGELSEHGLSAGQKGVEISGENRPSGEDEPSGKGELFGKDDFSGEMKPSGQDDLFGNGESLAIGSSMAKQRGDFTQLSLFSPPTGPEQEVLEKLKSLDINHMTPMEALNLLDTLHRSVLGT